MTGDRQVKIQEVLGEAGGDLGACNCHRVPRSDSRGGNVPGIRRAPPKKSREWGERPQTMGPLERPRDIKGMIQGGDLLGSPFLGPCGSGPGPGDILCKAAWHLPPAAVTS